MILGSVNEGTLPSSAMVSIGDVGVIASETISLGESIVAGRSIDDRAGATVALEALRRVVARGSDVSVVAVATAQEEISGRSGGSVSNETRGV